MRLGGLFLGYFEGQNLAGRIRLLQVERKYFLFFLQIYDDEPCDEGEGSTAVPKLCVIHLMGRTDKIEDANNYLRQMKCKNGTKHLGANNHHMLFGIKANW